MMSARRASALSRNKGGLTPNGGGIRKLLQGSTGESRVNSSPSFKPFTSIALQDALIAHLSSLQHIMPYWFPILVDKKDDNGTIVQTSGLSQFLGYDDPMTLEFLRICGLIKYVPRHKKYGITKDVWPLILERGENQNARLVPYQPYIESNAFYIQIGGKGKAAHDPKHQVDPKNPMDVPRYHIAAQKTKFAAKSEQDHAKQSRNLKRIQ